MKKIICFGIALVSLIVILVIAFSGSSKDYKYVVKFEDNFGGIYKVVYVEEDGIVPFQSAPNYFLYEFDYWYEAYSNTYTTPPFDFDQPIDGDIILAPKYNQVILLSEQITIDGIIYECYTNGEAIVYRANAEKANVTILDKVTIDNKKYNVKYIGYNAFYNNTYLENIVIPDSVTHLFSSVFSGCTSLKSVTLSNNLVQLGTSVFYDCNSLTSITIPSSVQSISKYCFASCTSLKNVTLSKGVKYIDDYAFDGCFSLNSISLPNTIEHIGSRSFSDCISLEEINLSKNLYSIDYAAFENCQSLSTIELNEKLTFIERSVFDHCTSLEEIKVNSNNKYFKSIDGNVYTKDEIEFVVYAVGKKESIFTIPESVKVIGKGAFSCADNLIEVILPTNLEEISSEVFLFCSNLTTVKIPSSVISIGAYSFFMCDSLTIYCEVSTKPDGWDNDWCKFESNVVWGYED